MASGANNDVVLTPLRSSSGGNILKVERMSADQLDTAHVQHIAGGPYKGIIINKATNETPSVELPDTSRSFVAHVNKGSKEAGQEQRKLRFWFKKSSKKSKSKTREKTTDKFVSDLIYSDDFPRDYISFVKRVLELTKEYPTVDRLEMEFCPISVATQEDQQVHLGGAATAAHGSLQNGNIEATSAPKYGASLDPSARAVPSQDDQLRKHHGKQGASTEADFDLTDRADTAQGPTMVAVTKATTGSRGNQGYLDELAKEEPLPPPPPPSLSSGAGSPSYLSELQVTKTVEEPVQAASANTTGGRGNQDYLAKLEEPVQAASANTTGGRGNQDYLAKLEEPVQAASTSTTGGRENKHYVAKLKAAETVTSSHSVEERAIPQPVQPTGGKGSSSYDADLRRAELLKAAGAGPSPGTELEERQHVQAPVTGSKGSTSYEAELLAGSGRTQEDQLPEPAVVSETAPLTGGTTGSTQYARTTKVTTRTVRTVQGGSSEEVVQQTTSTTGGRGSSSYDAFLKAGMSQDDYQKLIEGQEEASLRGSSVSYSTASPAKGAQVKKRLVITRRGWSVIWVARKQRLLNVLEEAYPNILSAEDMVKLSHMKRHDCEYILQDLSSRGMVREIEQGRWMRLQKKAIQPSQDKDQHAEEYDISKKHDFQVVQHVPVLPDNEQPTIAIITLLYCEKLAVDSMMSPKTTYVRYKTEGESQVYTVGLIGKHRVVSTKLSRIGRAKAAMTAAGNNVTRLMGIFSRVECVFLIGVAGGISNYKDDRKHVRLGDVVMSTPEYPSGPIYVNCTGVEKDPSGDASFSTQSWNPREDTLNGLIQALEVRVKQEIASYTPSWEMYIEEGLEELQTGETRFTRPDPETDKLYKRIRGKVIEVPHPDVMEGSQRALRPELPILHLGVVGCGKDLLKDDSLKQDFALFNEVKAIDLGFRAVMESIEGSRKDSFAVIRGISDYEDGTKKKEWQPYAALAAAACLKALVLEIPTEEEEDY